MADTNQVLMLAAIIRKVGGNHSKGAAALAESILDHPSFHKCCTVPAPPADGEVAELVAWLRETGWLLSRRPDIQCRIELRLFARAAELLQRRVLVPEVNND